MKKYLVIITIGMLISSATALLTGCAAPKEIADKGGSELWSENCGRCHNAPGGSVYSSEQWDVIGTHMRMRAHLTAVEAKKITEFLQAGN